MKDISLFAKITIALVTVTVMAGCSFIFDPGYVKKPGESKRKSISSGPIVEKREAGIEVTWEVPSDFVDGFVIRYGEDRMNLSKEATILRPDLREERDSQYGPVYRYILRDIPDSGRVYVSVAAFKGDAISDFSDAVVEGR